MANNFSYKSTGVDVSPAGLDGTVYWYDSGETNGSEPVYYDKDEQYAYWVDSAYWYITEISSVGTIPTDNFLVDGSSFTASGSWSATSFEMVAESNVESNWSWGSINRARDYSYVGYNEYYRENWQLTRTRISSLEFDSQLGETESNFLTAYNGNRSKDIYPPTFDSISFLQDFTGEDWIKRAGGPVNEGVITTLVGEEFYKAKWKCNGAPVYIMSGMSPLNIDELIMCFYDPSLGDYSTYWHCVSRDSSDVSSGNFPDDILPTTDEDEQYITGWNTTVDTIDPTYSGYISTGTTPLDFRCISDSPTYQTTGVEWYKQTQIWQAKSPWS